MVDKKRNTWGAKVMRTFTSVLPVAKNRIGSCSDCGVCCKLPNAATERLIFLMY